MFAVGINNEIILCQHVNAAESNDVSTMHLVDVEQFDAEVMRPVKVISGAAAFLLAGIFSLTRGENVRPLPIPQ